MAPAATLDRIPKILRGAIAAVAHGGWEELRTSLDARHLGNKIGASSATDG
jgi:hypothetical protein